ncbi:TfuA-like protein [Streptomyces sp. NPDC098077]|uniref:TfuA-like protein n=1 Tax=Streptomyces sp. NPDC098077 TaxID=3366093 RepID=UPI003820B089
MTNVHLFVGPSAVGMKIPVPDDIEVHPPARRGAVHQLIERHSVPGVILLADGTFHSYPAVGHRELRDAIESGWQAWGLCSMGAIRAAEMLPLGMRGYGAVFQAFAEDPEFADDEVALVHGLEPPFRPVSEPMIHIRAYFDHLRMTGALAPEHIDQALAHFKCRWYAERSLPALVEYLTDLGHLTALEDIRDFDRFRLKTRDLESFLTDRPWTLKETHA